MAANSNQSKYSELQTQLNDLQWILKGSVMKIAPRSATGNTTYTWTRKIRAKTVTLSLSYEQYRAVKKAIEANRRVEKTLKAMRKISEKTLMETLPGVQKRPRLSRENTVAKHS